MGDTGAVMFGLFKRRDAAPLQVEADMDIDRPVEAVYALLDMASPTNAMRERGHEVLADPDVAGRFHADEPSDASIGYVINVEEAQPPHRYVTRLSFAGGRAVGVVLRDRSVYSLMPDDKGGGGCRVILESEFEILPGISQRKQREHQGMLVMAVWNDLLRLKIHAEQGAAAAKAAQL